MLVGDIKSAGELGTNENPVTAPLAPRLTTAVTCCHRGLLAESTGFAFLLMRWLDRTGY
jgi:hypothetical protein